MRKRQLYVQFFVPKGATTNNTGALLECLRYAGKLIYTIEAHGWIVAVPAPKGVDAGTWCDMQSQRMKSFGFKTEIVENAKQPFA